MMIWSSAFQHQFLDGNPANLTAVPGQLTIEPEGLEIHPTPPADERGFGMWPGHRLKYAFADAFEQVIGADIRLDLFVPPGSEQELAGFVGLGGGTVGLGDYAVGLLIIHLVGGGARLVLWVGTSVMSVSVPAMLPGPVSVRARWHTHGQGHIWVDGRLRAYDPSLAAQASLTLDQLFLGRPSPLFTPAVPGILARRLGIRLLREDGPARYLDTFFPIVEPLAIPEACQRQVEEIHGFARGEIMRFMSEAISRLTSPWNEGQGGEPFSAQAIAAHDAATAAGQAFVRFMLNGRAADAQQVQDQIGAFLAVIEATDPAGYQALVDRIAQVADGLEPHCRLALEAAAQPYATSLGPLAELFQKIWARVQTPGGHHG
jgi:hypothetical protein